jgi:membrane protein DedA with SNARE-associated domain
LVPCITLMDHLATQILDIIKGHPGWASFVIGLTAFGESFLLLSLLFPGTAVLICCRNADRPGRSRSSWVVTAAIVGAVLGDAVSFWLGQKFGDLVPNLWRLRGHPERLRRGVDFFFALRRSQRFHRAFLWTAPRGGTYSGWHDADADLALLYR